MRTDRLTQIDKIKEHIDIHGSISRNFALDLRITRLGAIVHTLRKPPYSMRLKGRYVKTQFGKDYIYKNEIPKFKHQEKLL